MSRIKIDEALFREQIRERKAFGPENSKKAHLNINE